MNAQKSLKKDMAFFVLMEQATYRPRKSFVFMNFTKESTDITNS